MYNLQMTAKKPAKTQKGAHSMTHGKSLVYGDCMEVMDRWLAEGYGGKANLIYLDPPFNSNAKYNILYGEEGGGGKTAQVVAFDDTWTWDAAAAGRMDDLRSGDLYSPKMKRTVDGLEALLEKGGMLAYLSYMAQRLDRCRRLLAEDGSIYLHCDPTASHYLKILMDAIFGAKNFRNEIVWCYTGPSRAAHSFPAKHDTILFYANSESAVFYRDAVRIPYKSLGAGRGGGVIFPRGHDQNRIEELRKIGKVPESWWVDILPLTRQNKERLGYPTQKPVALLRRIISASSNKGDLVLDPFCGCGTTVVAANELKRKWIGIDISAFPVELIRSRLHRIRKQIHVEGIPRDMKGARLLAQKPFEFEKWAIALIPGMLPNIKQTGDGGVDGRGWMQEDIAGAEKPAAAKTPLVIAQVTVSPGINLNKIRALANSMKEKSALFGVYITPDKIAPTQSVAEILATAGTVAHRGKKYPRLQLWSVEEYFEEREAKLPPLSTPRIQARDSAKSKIAQGDIAI